MTDLNLVHDIFAGIGFLTVLFLTIIGAITVIKD